MSTVFRRGLHSSSSTFQRTYRLVTQRRVAQIPTVEEGDLKPWNLQIPTEIPTTPVYKYGESNWFKQSNRGLYGGQFPGSGNKVSEEGHTTPRTWKVNVIRKHLWSESLNKSIKLKTTGRVLRTLKKEGGLDNYLLKEKSARVKELGPFGYKLKYEVLQAQKAEEAAKSKKPIPRVRDPANNNELVKLYHIVTLDGTKYKFKVGKKKMLRALYSELVKQHIEQYSWMQFNTEYQPKSVEEIVAAMVEHNVDLSSLTV